MVLIVTNVQFVTAPRCLLNWPRPSGGFCSLGTRAIDSVYASAREFDSNTRMPGNLPTSWRRSGCSDIQRPALVIFRSYPHYPLPTSHSKLNRHHTHHGGSRRDCREPVRPLLVLWCILTEPRSCSQSRGWWRRFRERGWERLSQGRGYEAKTVCTLNCTNVVSLTEHLILRSRKRRNSGGPEAPVQDSPLRYVSHPITNQNFRF